MFEQPGVPCALSWWRPETQSVCRYCNYSLISYVWQYVTVCVYFSVYCTCKYLGAFIDVIKGLLCGACRSMIGWLENSATQTCCTRNRFPTAGGQWGYSIECLGTQCTSPLFDNFWHLLAVCILLASLNVLYRFLCVCFYCLQGVCIYLYVCIYITIYNYMLHCEKHEVVKVLSSRRIHCTFVGSRFLFRPNHEHAQIRLSYVFIFVYGHNCKV